MTQWSPLDRPLVSTRHLGAVLGIRREYLRELADQAERMYSPFTLVQIKKGRRKERPIDNPLEPLKLVQTRIKRRLLDPVTLPSFMCGGVRKRSTQTNARKHVRQPEVVALDIRKFFGSVTNNQVAEMWRARFGASSEVVYLLTRLTTYHGHLPQGAPTSTALANLVILPGIERLYDWCRSQDMNLTIYVDDITVSGREARRSIPVAAHAVSRAGFKLARDKVKVMPSHARQEVTGHTVNRRLSNGRDLLKRARSMVFSAIGLSGTEDDRKRARGLVAHICATSPSQGRWLAEKLADASSPE